MSRLLHGARRAERSSAARPPRWQSPARRPAARRALWWQARSGVVSYGGVPCGTERPESEHEPDADEREAEIAGGPEVVPAQSTNLFGPLDQIVAGRHAGPAGECHHAMAGRYIKDVIARRTALLELDLFPRRGFDPNAIVELVVETMHLLTGGDPPPPPFSPAV